MNKSNLIFLDTETTGRGPNDRLCQVAYKFQGEERESLFKPSLPIEIEAMAVSHITNKMVADKEPFVGSSMQKEIENILSSGNILVAHNAAFDVEMLRRENVKVEKFIDTFKLAHEIDGEAEIPKHSLQYLRYYFDLEVENAPAHNALGDVRVLEQLFEVFFEKMMMIVDDEERVIEKMLEISARPVFVKKFSFGKYAGMFVGEVATKDRGYLEWLLNEKLRARSEGDENDENWIFTLEHYLK